MTTYGPRSSVSQVMHPFQPTKRLLRIEKRRYVQKPITDRPLPYLHRRDQILGDPAKHQGDAPNHQASVLARATSGSVLVNAKQRAYGKFKDACYSQQAQVAANWAERRQTVDMIADNANTMRKAWQALRRGRLREFKQHLRLDPRGNYWSRPTDAAKIWLQYHFGWEPLVKDIHASVEILQSKGPSGLVQGRGSAREELFVFKYNAWNYNIAGKHRYLYGAKVSVSNPNLHRATALGLTNPAAVLWEVIPFSFLVDWFIPVGEFLNQWTDFLGLTFEDAFTTRSSRYEGTQFYLNPDGTVSPSLQNGYGKCLYLERQLGIVFSPMWPYPKAFKGFSVVRGATAISLLLAVLKPGVKLPQPRLSNLPFRKG